MEVEKVKISRSGLKWKMGGSRCGPTAMGMIVRSIAKVGRSIKLFIIHRVRHSKRLYIPSMRNLNRNYSRNLKIGSALRSIITPYI